MTGRAVAGTNTGASLRSVCVVRSRELFDAACLLSAVEGLRRACLELDPSVVAIRTGRVAELQGVRGVRGVRGARAASFPRLFTFLGRNFFFFVRFTLSSTGPRSSMWNMVCQNRSSKTERAVEINRVLESSERKKPSEFFCAVETVETVEAATGEKARSLVKRGGRYTGVHACEQRGRCAMVALVTWVLVTPW